VNINLTVDIEQNSFQMQTSALKVSSVILQALSYCGKHQPGNCNC